MLGAGAAAAGISVNSPSGDIWDLGVSRNIEWQLWQGQSTAEQVTIKLWKLGMGEICDIAVNIPISSASYKWTVGNCANGSKITPMKDYKIRIQGTNFSNDSNPFTIGCRDLSITTASLPPATVGTAYNAQLQSSGGYGTIQWRKHESHPLPPGLWMRNDGMLVGTPTSAGSYSVRVRAEDLSCPVGAQSQLSNLSVTVATGPAASSTTTTPKSSLPDKTYKKKIFRP